MSRIGSMPIELPSGVSLEEKGREVTVKGPKGSLGLTLRPEIDMTIDGATVTLAPNGSGSSREARAFHGLTRALLSNMVAGVTDGFSKTLVIIGVGWNAQAQGKQLTLNIGFCHPVVFSLPDGRRRKRECGRSADVHGSPLCHVRSPWSGTPVSKPSGSSEKQTRAL